VVARVCKYSNDFRTSLEKVLARVHRSPVHRSIRSRAPSGFHRRAFSSLALRFTRLPMIFVRALSFNFFHCLHSTFVRVQPTQKPVFPSNLQMPMQGDSTAMEKSNVD
jgi:hypothetical protein